MQFNNVILAAGNYPVHSLPAKILAKAKTVVCCDSAAERFITEGGTPTAIVGDGDSLPQTLKEQYAPLFHQEQEQETNDLSKAVRYLLQQGKKQIAILGATGKREDHTLGNISLLVEYMRQGADVRMFTDYGVFIPCRGDQTFAVTPGQQVSLFSFGAKNLHAEGLKYPIYDFTSWWQGTLNEATTENLTIHADGDWLIYLPYFFSDVSITGLGSDESVIMRQELSEDDLEQATGGAPRSVCYANLCGWDERCKSYTY